LFHVEAQGASDLRAGKTSIIQKFSLALPLRVIGRLAGAKFLPLNLAQVQHPVRISRQAFLDQLPLQALLPQTHSHAHGTLASRRMIRHEVLHIPPVIDEFFGAQRLDQRRDNAAIVTFFEQFSA
jgi:hypothetical protein